MIPLAVSKPRRNVPIKNVSEDVEELHYDFLDFCFKNNIRSVTEDENETHRILRFSDGSKIQLNKSTHLLEYDFQNHNWGTTQLINKDADVAYFLKLQWIKSFSNYASSFDLAQKAATKDLAFSIKRNEELEYAGQKIASRKIKYSKSLSIYCYYKSSWGFLFDRETAALTINLFGRMATFEHYNFIVNNFEYCLKMKRQYPNLTELIGKFIYNESNFVPIANDLDVIKKIKQLLLSESGVKKEPISMLFSESKFNDYEKEVLSQSGWRLLSNMSKPCVKLFLKPGFDNSGGMIVENNLFLLNVVSEAGVNPTFSHLKKLIYGHYEGNLRKGEKRVWLTRLIRLTVRESFVAKKRGKLKEFLSNEFDLVKDWFFQSVQDGYPAIPKNSTWKSIFKHQADWHDELHAARRLRDEIECKRTDAMSWCSVVDAILIDGYEIQAITNGRDLREEGVVMQHCCQTYTYSCVDGRSMIFSIIKKDNNKERATLEICHNPTRINQVRGIRNKPVGKEINLVSKKFVKIYSKLLSKK